jgi:serine/threonine-protein kinase
MSEPRQPESTEHHEPSAESPRPEKQTILDSLTARYRPLRYHAMGGMGVICVAIDRELQREVAFKEIKREYADHPEALTRFVREAEVTGRLQHPGIVPVYSLGYHSDGRPFYTMRFIEGASLHTEIRQFHDAQRPRDGSERSLALQRLLRRFIDVCYTISYAHSRGYLHRDLKPANVMLGPFGETLVVDWGLAKSLGNAPTSTRDPSDPLATVSPGHSTLLLGEPVVSAPMSSFTLADDGQIPADLGVEHQTRLGAILGTAAYMPPEQASGHIDQLSEASDIYSLGATLYEILTGQTPFEGESSKEVLDQVRQGCFRRPREVLSSVPRELDAVVMRAMAFRPEDRYSTARALAEDVEKWLADLEAEAIAAIKAREALQSAQEQRQLALETLRKVVEDIDSQLKHQPGLQAVRKALLKDVLSGLNRVARAADTTDAIDHQTIAVHFEMGDIYLYFESGGASQALAQYRKAHELARKFVEAQPDNLIAQRDWSRSWRRLGDVELRTGNTGPALEAYQQSLDVAKRLSEIDPQNREIRRELSVAWEKYGDILVQRGEFTHALGVFQISLDLREGLVREEPEETSYRKDLTRAWIKLGNILSRLGKPPEALEAFLKGLGLAQKLAEEQPNDPSSQRHLCRALGRTGDMQLQLGRFDEALQTYQQNVDICQQLAEEDPSNLQARSDLSKAWNRLGDVFAQMGEPRRALMTHQNALTIALELTAGDSTNAPIQRDLSFIWSKMGELQHRLGDYEQAHKSLSRMLEIRKKLADADKDNAQAHRDLQSGYTLNGYLALERKDWPKALQGFEKALKVAEEFVKPEFFKQSIPRLKKKIEECRSRLDGKR